jgi:hypothetical protein
VFLYSYLLQEKEKKNVTFPVASTPDRIIQEARQIAQDPLSSTPVRSSTTNNNLDDDTVLRSGNPSQRSSSKKKKKPATVEEELAQAKAQIAHEKAGKRKLFHSLVKLANELRRVRTKSSPLLAQRDFEEQPWHQGGIWRAPTLLPGVLQENESQKRTMTRRPALSLSSLFFNLVIVTALTRVGVVISQMGYIDLPRVFYFAIFWTIWSKQASYNTRFDTSDVSATIVTLVTCFAILFASLSVPQPLDTEDASRILACAAFCAGLHALLHVRVAITGDPSNALSQHVAAYAMLNIVLFTVEMVLYLIAILVFDVAYHYRWLLVLAALISSMRVPRAFLANDFHAACSQRSVLFILLLGFLLQSVVVVASEFFSYQTPSLQDYAFLGAACLLFFCIKLLYVDDDSDTLAEDHALLVNRAAGFFFNVGQFMLLLSTTVMGSGLNLLTHEYLAATAALPGPSKHLVCGGFAACLLSTLFLKSMHLKRIPTAGRNKALFIAAYVVQTLVLLTVAGMGAYMAFGTPSGWFGYLMETDMQLLWALAVGALFAVLMSWLDEGVDLALYASMEDAQEFRIHPFGFWWCLKPEISQQEVEDALLSDDGEGSTAEARKEQRLSQLSPLLGSSLSDMKNLDYDSIPKEGV